MFSIVQIATTIPFRILPWPTALGLLLALIILIIRLHGFPKQSAATPPTGERLEPESNRS